MVAYGRTLCACPLGLAVPKQPFLRRQKEVEHMCVPPGDVYLSMVQIGTKMEYPAFRSNRALQVEGCLDRRTPNPAPKVRWLF